MLDSFKMHVFFGFSLHLDMLLQCFYCLFLPPIVSDYLAIIFFPHNWCFNNFVFDLQTFDSDLPRFGSVCVCSVYSSLNSGLRG